MTISLGRELPHTSCSLPEPADLAVQATSRRFPKGSALLDLAPSGGYLAANVTACAGGLLRHLFTLTPCPFTTPKTQRENLGEEKEQGAVCFCGPIRQVAHTKFVQAPRPGNYPAPCPVECGLSSMDTSTAVIRSAWGLS